MLKINLKKRKFLKYSAFVLLSIPLLSFLLKLNPLKSLFKEFKGNDLPFEYVEED